MRDRPTERSARSIPAAVAAWFLLGCLVAGAPLGLAYLIGWPLSGMHVPHGLPRHPWTAHTLARCGALLAWGLWAQFTACVVVEIRSVRTGVERPSRVPGAGASRTVARALIAVALTAGISGVSGAAMAGPAHVSAVVAAVSVGGDSSIPVSGAATRAPSHEARQDVAPPVVPAAAAQTLAAPKFYLVQPPRGRQHDSLWDIAQRYLGDGHRYGEIYALNEGRLQPDGSVLKLAGVIRPGWILALPADAQGPGLADQPPAARPAAGSAQTRASAPPADQAAAAFTGVGAPNPSTPATHAPDAQPPVWRDVAPKTFSVPVAPSGGAAKSVPPSTMPHPVASRPAMSHAEPVGARPGQDGSALHSIADVLPYVALIGSPVLAAALLTALTAAARRRRRERPAAAFAAVPDPAVAEVERTIRAAACDTVDFVDHALRVLRDGADAAGRTPPRVRHARVGPGALHLALDDADLHAPAPWTALAGGRQWSLERAAAPEPGPGERTPVPYPLLLCVGSLGDEQVLVDLEAAGGRCTAVAGPARQRRAFLAAAAATLGAGPWADQVRIESVGLPAELALLAPERLRVHPDLGAALTALERDAAATGPHLVRLLVAENVSGDELSRLRALTERDSGTSALIGTDRPLPDTDTLSVDQVGRLRVPGVPGELAASRLPDALAAALGALFRSAAAPRYAPAYRPADVPLSGGVELMTQPVGVRAAILGPIELAGVGGADAARGPLFTEALILLLFHRAGLPAAVFARALWPRGITPAARDRMLRDMREWLGEGPAGPRLTIEPDSFIRLGGDVRSDWDEFQAAYREADRLAHQPEAAQSALARALALVRGELLADRPPGRYSWLGFGTQETEVPAVVADAAYRFASRRLYAGDHDAAQWAARQGLLGAPDDERLVQLDIRTIAGQGDRDRLYSAVADLKVRAWRRYGETELHPATGAVVAQLIGRGV